MPRPTAFTVDVNGVRPLAMTVLILSAAGCGVATPSGAMTTPVPPPSASVRATATSAATPQLEVPAVLLDVRAGSDPSQPGTISPSCCGSLTRGPETLAVDDAGVVWLYDQAKSRVVGYEQGRFARGVDVPDVPRGASALLVANGRLFFKVIDDVGTVYAELEMDGMTGELMRRSDTRTGAPSLYPYERVPRPYMSSTAKGVDELLGRDAFGNRYERHYFMQWSAGQCFSVIRRITPSGQSVAEACFDVGSHARDYFVGRDGAVYQLEQLYSGPTLDRFVVTRIMSPAR